MIIYLQPKDGLDKIKEELLKIPCDKLILKYIKYPEVYRIAQKTIESHPEYDSIIWVQNDIIFTVNDYEKLCKSFKVWKLDILGCSMNVDLSVDGLDLCAFTVDKFTVSPGMSIPWVKLNQFAGLVKVFHNGSVFIARREFLMAFPLTGIGKAGYNADIKHGTEIAAAGINYYVDTSIRLKHLRYQGINKVGKKLPGIEFIEY